VSVFYHEEFTNVGDAFAREKRVQGWSRGKRRALIEWRGEHLPNLSRKRLPS